MCWLLTQPAHGAYCALRDPVASIAALFPAATSHRSIVRVVGEAERLAVSAQLPPNVLHFSELGQHTLYVVFADEQPLGYVHVRSEESEWGLVEIAWAIDTELKVVDFKFQRCRSRSRKALEDEGFRKQFRGLDFTAMKGLLASDFLNLDTQKLQVPAGAEALAGVVLRCGLKTLLVTEMVWREDIARYAAQAKQAAGLAETTVLPVQLPSDLVQQTLQQAFAHGSVLMDVDSAQVLTVQDTTGQVVGAIYRNHVALGEATVPLEWHINANGEVLRVENLDRWPDQRTAKAFAQAVGSTFAVDSECADRPALLTKQAVLTAQVALR
ncbi:MAG: hypothetical protein AAF529_19765 [Pseudomonadota bacterium]